MPQEAPLITKCCDITELTWEKYSQDIDELFNLSLLSTYKYQCWERQFFWEKLISRISSLKKDLFTKSIHQIVQYLVGVLTARCIV